MPLTLHYHPLASYCWKVLIGFYEKDTPFERVIVDLGEAGSRAAFLRLAPLGRMPALAGGGSGEAEVISESTAILEYLDIHHRGGVRLVPAESEAAWRTRLWDRIFDLHVHEPMQKVVGDRLRPPEAKDPQGVAEARQRLAAAYDLLVDCAAAPALHYANRVQPLASAHPATAGYLAWLEQRPSVVRVLAEAAPYARLFPAG